MLKKLAVLDIGINESEFVDLIERLGRTSETQGEVKIETIVEAMTSMSGVAKASSLFDLRCMLDQTRRELADHTSKVDTRLDALEEKLDVIVNRLASLKN